MSKKKGKDGKKAGGRGNFGDFFDEFEDERFCIFCGKSPEMVEDLVAGPPGVYICNECIDVCTQILHQSRKKEKEETEPFLKTIPAPVEIHDYLNGYVIGHALAKKVLSVAVHNHYKRIMAEEEKTGKDEVELEKSNVLLVGPTGSGKTLLAKTLARFLHVPFAIADATTLTEAGYVGEDVENILLKLLQAADHDIQRAERGIIYIDELDKIGRRSENPSITRDVSGEGVQQALLKIIEGTVANIPPQGGRKHPEQKYIQMDTSRILFIGGGTFSGLHEIIGKRLGRKMLGFHKDARHTRMEDMSQLLRQVEPDDLLKFGLIPELIGRLPVTTELDPLSEDDLVHILLKPKNAIIKQYQKFFSLEKASLEFTADALQLIAQKARKKETGARALRTILESIMLEIMYHLPSTPDIKQYVITPEVIDKGYTALKKNGSQSKRARSLKEDEGKESA